MHINCLGNNLYLQLSTMNSILLKAKAFFLQHKTLAFLYFAIALLSSIQLLVADQNNNFYIFRASSQHLLRGLPLYIEYPKEYFDFFYYHPVFPVLFLPFSLLPLYPSLVLWLFCTAATCYFLFRKIPLPKEKVSIFLFLMIFDVLNNLNHTQTNPFILAFMLLAWVLMEKEKFFTAALFITLCFLIKGYGGIIALLCLYYRNWWKMIFYGLFWFLALNALLLLFISPSMIVQYYTDWLAVISGNGIKESYSVYGLLKNMHENLPEGYILGSALAILGAFLSMQYFIPARQKSHIVAFLLIWVIVFNRAAESATYLFAIAGCIIWYLSRPANKISSVLFWVTILISSIIPTDISDAFDHFRYDNYLKCILCLLVMADMFVYTIGALRNSIVARKTVEL